jgi:hypothetical protein
MDWNWTSLPRIKRLSKCIVQQREDLTVHHAQGKDDLDPIARMTWNRSQFSLGRAVRNDSLNTSIQERSLE